MYNSFFGFNSKPFNITPDPDNLYMSPSHKSALTHLEYGLIAHIGLMVLTGEVGTGKTTLIRFVTDHFCKEMQLATIYQTNVTPNEFFRQILSAFDIQTQSDRKDDQVKALKQFLKQKDADQKQVLIIVDEAQGLSDETLEEVRLLTNIQMDYPNILQIILIGQPELLERLRTIQWISLGQRIGVNYHLKALSPKQTCQYIAHRLKIVGGNPKLFNNDAINRIFKSSEGIPRLINLICDAALVYAFGDALETIGGPLITTVVRERAGMGLRNQLEAYSRQMAAKKETHNGHYEERLSKIEADIAVIRNQLDFQKEDISILNTSSQEDMHKVVKRIIVKERRLRDQLHMEIKQLKQALKKANIPYPAKPIPVKQMPAKKPAKKPATLTSKMLHKKLTQTMMDK